MENKTVLSITAVVNKEHMAEVQTYLGSVMQVFGKNGGKPIARFKTIESLVGEDTPEMMALIEFDNAEIIKNMISGEDFNALSELRAKVFLKLNMFISSSM